MKLNQIMIAAAFGMIVSSTTYAADGTLNIQGTILDSACTVSSDDVDLNVVLGEVNKSAFTTDGAPVGAKKFDISLTNCPATATTVHTRFDGAGMNGASNLLALTETGDEAQGVGVGLYEMDNSQIELATDTKPVNLVNQAATLEFKAAYVAPAVSGVTAGPANSSAEFTIITQ